MSEIITTKTLREVVIEPLDGSGRTITLYGLSNERLRSRVHSPSRRAVSRDTITQQRRVARRRYELEVTIFEPAETVSDGGSRFSPASSGVYEGTDKHVSAARQLTIVDELMRLHEEGVLMRYSGVAVDIPRCAILSFDADLVYATGRGTLVIEERPEKTINIESAVVSLEAIEHALQELAGTTPDVSNGSDFVNDLLLNQMNPNAEREFIETYIGGALREPGSRFVQPVNETSTKARFGVDCLPITVSKAPDLRQVFPNDPARKKPSVSVIPLETVTPAFQRRKSNINPRYSGKSPIVPSEFAVVVHHAGFFVKFRFEMNAVDTSWLVTAEVYENTNVPVTDIRGDVISQKDEHCDAPTARPSGPPVPAGFSAPVYVTPKQRVVFGQEIQLSQNSTFAFIGEGGKDPFAGRVIEGRWSVRDLDIQYPRGEEINRMALIMADYA